MPNIRALLFDLDDTLYDRESPGEPITKTLIQALKARQMLLVLDNCEHVLDASARLVDALLNEADKALLCGLSVFVGGWTLGAAERVCSGEGVEDWETVDLLTSLVAKSLVVYEEREDMARYRLLETVSQYARDRLVERGESEAVRRSHRDYALGMVEEAEPNLTGPDTHPDTHKETIK